MSTWELISLWCLALIVFLTVFCRFHQYVTSINSYGDNAQYLVISSAIRHWSCAGVEPKHAWGLSYLIALVSMLGVSASIGLLAISLACSLASAVLVCRLWSGWVAGYFAVINFAWLQRSALGGSEPLFLLVVLSSVAACRSQRWILASVLASISATGRRVGVLMVVAIIVTLLWHRRRTIVGICVAADSFIIAAIYLQPFWLCFHDPLAGFRAYRVDWDSNSPIAFPFRALLHGALSPGRPLTNVLLNASWIAFAAAGLALMLRQISARRLLIPLLPETLFAILYVIFLMTYNSTDWAFSEFPRFAVPIVPMVLGSFGTLLPKSRTILWLLAAICGFLAGASAVGIRFAFRSS